MSDYKIIPSSVKYPSSPNNDQSIDLFLSSGNKEVLDLDRSLSVNLQDVYDDERQNCTRYRPTFKINLIYNNAYTGTTQYEPLKNNLYYVNPEYSLDNNIWYGYPQYYEFDFFRPPTYEHIDYKPKSGFTYNWSYYLSYVFDNDYDKRLSYYDGFSTAEWTVSDGIPFRLSNNTSSGVKLISFVCFMPHNLTPGEFVELPFSYQNTNKFEVYSLGDGTFDSDKYIFNIVNFGYTGNTFNDGKVSTFKRIITPNKEETKSKYYIRKHKIITISDDIDVSKAGFEKLPFSDDKKLEYNILTPDKRQRVSQKSSNNTYNFTLKDSVDISGLLDNQKRPISEIYFTIIHKGYYGLFNKPNGNIALKEGWSFNLTQENNSWWLSNASNSNIGVNSYSVSGRNFYYNKDLAVGDVLYGDFCEWNDFEQNEYVISKYYNKITYNNDIFDISSANGFYYEPHNKMVIRTFSDYVEVASSSLAADIPNWAFYSTIDNEFRWRDLYDIGFIDNTGVGVDYPYLNNAHYPFAINIFRVFSEGRDNVNSYGDFVYEKIVIDGCE